MAYVKHLVSKKKRRYKEGGFDLDLAYIKPNIVAMGFPSENFEGVYRNSSDDVIKFLEFKHKDKYKIYNLCSEKFYDASKFFNRVAFYGFDDHNAPPFKLIEPCCRDMDEWLSKSDNNVAIVHCKAGKGRTGVMICSYLLYKRMYVDAEEAMYHYAKARTENEKGVTIPSQRRYITYFGYYIGNSLAYTPSTVLLNSITFVGTPTFTSGTCSPSFVIYHSTKVVLLKSKTYEIRRNESDPTTLHLDSPIPICGDIKIDFFHHKDRFRKERMFVFWFNTYFLEHGVTLNHPKGGGTITTHKNKDGDEFRTYELTQLELDKANKDKKNKFFPPDFKIKLNFAVPSSKDESDGAKSPRSPTSIHEVCGNVQSLSLEDTRLSPPNSKSPKHASNPSSPCTSKRDNQSKSDTDISSLLSKSEEDLSREPLSDDDDEEEDEQSSK